MEIRKILEDTRQLQKEINTLEGQLNRCFSIADETLFKVRFNIKMIIVIIDWKVMYVYDVNYKNVIHIACTLFYIRAILRLR